MCTQQQVPDEKTATPEAAADGALHDRLLSVATSPTAASTVAAPAALGPASVRERSLGTGGSNRASAQQQQQRLWGHGTTAATAESPYASLMLMPLSLTPTVAFNAQVQSVDLFGNTKAYDHGQGCCSYLCGRTGPVFDWVRYLHAAAHHRPAAAAAAAAAASPHMEPSQNIAQQQRQVSPLPAVSVQQQQDEERRLLVELGQQAPLGAPATLLTLFGSRQLVFCAVQEVNRAYTSFWRLLLLVLALVVLLLPGIGLLTLLLLGCCSTLRRMCDDAALQRMRAACEKADQRMTAYGMGLLLMEGYQAAPLRSGISSRDIELGGRMADAAALFDSSSNGSSASLNAAGDSQAAAALATLAAVSSHSSRIWVLRVYMLPRRVEFYTAGAAAAAAAAGTAVTPSSLSPAAVAAAPARRFSITERQGDEAEFTVEENEAQTETVKEAVTAEDKPETPGARGKKESVTLVNRKNAATDELEVPLLVSERHS